MIEYELQSEYLRITLYSILSIISIIFLIYFGFTRYKKGLADKAVKDAEVKAYGISEPDNEANKSRKEKGSQFYLYSKQIEKYQQQTITRASISFFFAIVAMVGCFTFLVWGGRVLLTSNEPVILASGSLISGIGGTLSAFIGKTFLDIHKVSLEQMNLYFRQPVVNEQILMAQRLADELNDEVKTECYKSIIDSIVKKVETTPK